MKNFTLAIVNAINEKSVNCMEPMDRTFYRIKKFESPGFQELETTLVLVRVSVVIYLNKILDQKFQNKVYHLFFQRKFLKAGVVTL